MNSNQHEISAEAKASRERREQLEDELRTLAGDLHAATYRFLTALAEFDRIGGWVGEGVSSCAQWLGWRCGVGMNTAREKVRVARALEELPVVAEKLEVGELSYSKARAITRIATPETEGFLVKCALSGTTGQVERLVRYARKYGPEAAEERAARIHADRCVKVWTDTDGAVNIKGRLPPELGAIVVRALDAAVDEAKKQAFEAAREAKESGDEVAEPDPHAFNPSFRWNRADALVDIAESFLARGYREGNAGERYQVVVHVDATPRRATGADHTGCANGAPSDPVDQPKVNEPDGVNAADTASGMTPPEAAPYIEDVGPIADSTALRIACDSSVVVMTEKDGDTIDVGRKTRTVPPSIRRALRHRDGG